MSSQKGLASVTAWFFLMLGAQLSASTFTTIYSFSLPNGAAGPSGALAIDSNGVIYGTTTQGGTGTQCTNGAQYGCGTVYSLTPPTTQGGAWSENTLWNFVGGTSDGANPQTGVVIGPGGVLYGTTCEGNNGTGVVYSLTPPGSQSDLWVETIISPPDGAASPACPSVPVIGSNGVLYLASQGGGTSNFGTVFSMTPPASPGGAWKQAVLWNFGSRKGDGRNPQVGVQIGHGGVLYGTTTIGGAQNAGTVFALRPPVSQGGAWTERILYSFSKSSRYTPSALAIGEQSALYGTATYRERHPPTIGGMVFSLTAPTAGGRKWTEATLWTMPPRLGGPDCRSPIGPLFVREKTGTLFGTNSGGLCDGGGVFALAPPVAPGGAWKHGSVSVKLPQSSLGLISGGVLYGTSSYLGASNTGSVWAVVP